MRIVVAHLLIMESTLARGLAAACLVSGPLFAHAADSPARLREDKYSIESRLRVPDGLEDGRYDVHCEVRVKPSGLPAHVSCYALGPGVPPKLVDAVSRATVRARFVPATHDGRRVEIYMVLMVRVQVTDGESLALALPNNGIEHARYGLFYIAPQRFNAFYWGDGYSTGARSGVLLWQELWIDEHGKVTDSRLTNASGASQNVVWQVRKSVESMRFMPGFFEGKPVPMHYIEPAYGD